MAAEPVATRLSSELRDAIYELDGEPSANLRALLLSLHTLGPELGIAPDELRADVTLALRQHYYPEPLRARLLALAEELGIPPPHARRRRTGTTATGKAPAADLPVSSDPDASPDPLAAEGFEF